MRFSGIQHLDADVDNDSSSVPVACSSRCEPGPPGYSASSSNSVALDGDENGFSGSRSESLSSVSTVAYDGDTGIHDFADLLSVSDSFCPLSLKPTCDDVVCTVGTIRLKVKRSVLNLNALHLVVCGNSNQVKFYAESKETNTWHHIPTANLSPGEISIIRMVMNQTASSNRILNLPRSYPLFALSAKLLPVKVVSSNQNASAIQQRESTKNRLLRGSSKDGGNRANTSCAGVIEINVHLRAAAVPEIEFPCQSVHTNVKQREIELVMDHFFDTGTLEYRTPLTQKKSGREDINAFYQLVRRKQKDEGFKFDKVETQHPSLVPLLRPYQRETVSWMLHRERNPCSWLSQTAGQQHPMFRKLTMPDHTQLWYNAAGGVVTREIPPGALKCSGGILAEEMGLGKTVEVLATILLNSAPCHYDVTGDDSVQVATALSESMNKQARMDGGVVASVSSHVECEEEIRRSPRKRKGEKRVDKLSTDLVSSPKKKKSRLSGHENRLECDCGLNSWTENGPTRVQCAKCGSWQHAKCMKYEARFPDPYLCPGCRFNEDPIKSAATLIVSPASISHQWYQEIQKHVRGDSLKVLIYPGVQSAGYIQPHQLAEQDIVITTYEILRSELNYSSAPENSRFRHAKRFNQTPTPLVSVYWWRVCLDEAQMVEKSSSKSATMCNLIQAEHRWCVTGTPLQRSVADLQGLLLFLGVEPYWCVEWWNKLLWFPYKHGVTEPMVDVMQELVWRNAKSDVAQQLGIPTQSVCYEWLDFSPIEEYFYCRTHEECAQFVRTIIANRNRFPDRTVRLSELGSTALECLLKPLLRIRQTCCHPQVARGQYLQIRNRDIMTMDHLLDRMLRTGHRKVEDSHRQSVSALCATAGVYILQEKYSRAADVYRVALRSIEVEHKHVRTDPLQRLHALHNLSWVLTNHGADILDRTTSDLRLFQAETLRRDYWKPFMDKVVSERRQQVAPTMKLNRFFAQRETEVLEWWFDLVSEMERIGADAELMAKIAGALDINKIHFAAKEQFESTVSLLVHLRFKLETLLESRHVALQQLDALSASDLNSDLVSLEASACHLRRDGSRKQTGTPCSVCLVEQLVDVYESNLFCFNPEDERLSKGKGSSRTTTMSKTTAY